MQNLPRRLVAGFESCTLTPVHLQPKKGIVLAIPVDLFLGIVTSDRAKVTYKFLQSFDIVISISLGTEVCNCL